MSFLPSWLLCAIALDLTIEGIKRPPRTETVKPAPVPKVHIPELAAMKAHARSESFRLQAERDQLIRYATR